MSVSNIDIPQIIRNYLFENSSQSNLDTLQLSDIYIKLFMNFIVYAEFFNIFSNRAMLIKHISQNYRNGHCCVMMLFILLNLVQMFVE